ncbi:hypothetical protein LGL08_20600 [Clostridium estertheticum]|uniref:hypothetical protein n=1 Tax=Clostridium estertheticum TaxID=238834 RepID=UPI001CF0FEE4|nr:hypothetical protein [Clostridium estertheticum]MCB2308891.1 hypothetical protein [Clostridium estertheticum]MCB2347303.1 hypothetical protein [Clostridium estertheticum]MCB2351930.1 hypothetical protein [Clostridium estertheticum]WAG48504.1 hypothetical protein LL127_23200 [Clostridium estertheticum]
MKLTNKRILDDAAGLSQLTQKSLPIKVSYAIAKNIAKIQPVLKIYNDEKQKLLDQYSVKNEEGKTLIEENNQATIQKEFLADWSKAIKELNEIENEIDVHKFNIDALLNSTCEMSPGEFMLIDYMIEEEK